MCFICLEWLNLFRKKERKKTLEKTLQRHCSFAPPRPSPPLAHSSRLMWTILLEHVKKNKSEVQFKNGVNQLYVPPWLKCEGYMRKRKPYPYTRRTLVSNKRKKNDVSLSAVLFFFHVTERQMLLCNVNSLIFRWQDKCSAHVLESVETFSWL